MTGFQCGVALQELYAHAGLEGLPIAMLEALGYGLPVLASDIPANIEVGLSAEHYFPLGNIEALTKGIRLLSSSSLTMEDRDHIRIWVTQRYDWRKIAEKTLQVYAHCMN